MNASATHSFTLRPDRVRESTSRAANKEIDRDLAKSIRFYTGASADSITVRLRELDKEWSIERMLETTAASVSLGGFLMSAAAGRKWLLLPVLVSSFLLKHALDGWCPPLEPLRRAGFRTRKEIERERTALRMLRGDFDGLNSREQNAANEVLKRLKE